MEEHGIVVDMKRASENPYLFWDTKLRLKHYTVTIKHKDFLLETFYSAGPDVFPVTESDVFETLARDAFSYEITGDFARWSDQYPQELGQDPRLHHAYLKVEDNSESLRHMLGRDTYKDLLDLVFAMERMGRSG
jgi:hypothetical protein